MIKIAAKNRNDVSQFVVHLTRNDTEDFSDGATALENLKSILKAKRILATRPHCIFNTEISELGKKFKKKCSVACFTETPLSEIHNLARKIEGRKIELEPFGLVFEKKLLIESGAQQAIYINSYNDNKKLRESVRELFNICKKDTDSKLVSLVPYLNAMHEKYDFTWEREWRLCKDFKFKLSEIVCVILPEEGHRSLKNKCAKAGIAVISPGWNYEHIVSQLANQQRETKRITLDVKAQKTKTEK
ncbi:hypothetical protein [Pseudoalteromonas gelatinilytica]